MSSMVAVLLCTHPIWLGLNRVLERDGSRKLAHSLQKTYLAKRWLSSCDHTLCLLLDVLGNTQSDVTAATIFGHALADKSDAASPAVA
jgi:hypothetical protein